MSAPEVIAWNMRAAMKTVMLVDAAQTMLESVYAIEHIIRIGFLPNLSEREPNTRKPIMLNNKNTTMVRFAKNSLVVKSITIIGKAGIYISVASIVTI
jgi:hypothetical protein